MPGRAPRLVSMLVLAIAGTSCSPDLTSTTPTTEAALQVGSTIDWSGRKWKVTTGSMVAGNTGSTANVFVDGAGNLHLRIAKVGGKWTCAELFTVDKLGFGTFQWQIEGRLDQLDKNVVLGLFPYGPAAGLGSDGHNEIDVEFARWGNSKTYPGNWTVYPATGSTVGSKSFNLLLTGTYTTSRFSWTRSSVTFWMMGGFQSPSSTANQLATKWTYSPSKPTQNIPQVAVPVGINLWLYNGQAPSDGKSVEIIIHSFIKN